MYISNDKEKIREFSDLRRLQLPTRLEISNFRSDVDTSTSTDSISQNSEKCQPLRQETSFFVVCFCSPVANSVHHPLQRIYHLHRVSFGFSRKISSAVDFSRSRRMRRVHKKTFRKLITNCMNRWQLLTKGLMVGLLPITVYPKPPELSTRPSARHMSTLSGRVWRAVVRS